MPGEGFVLLYHGMFGTIPENMATGLHNVAPDMFAKQLGWLKQYYDVVDVDTWLSLEDSQGKVAITFDAGYKSALVAALPILEDLDITAAFFVNGAMLDGQVFWRDKIRYLIHTGLAERFFAWLPPDAAVRKRLTPGHLFESSKDPQGINSGRLIQLVDDFLATAGIRMQSHCAVRAELPDDRHFIYGSHGYSHSVLASLSAESARGDVRRNQQVLSELPLAKARLTTAFAMPFGSPGTYTQRTLRILAEEGHPQVLLSGGKPMTGLQPRETPVRLVRRLTAPASLAALQARMGGSPPRERVGKQWRGPAKIFATTLPARGNLDPLALRDLIADLPKFAERELKLILGIGPQPGVSPHPASWSEITSFENLVRFARSVQYLVVTNRDEVPVICEELAGLEHGRDTDRPFFVFLVTRKAPPLHADRNDGPVASFFCCAVFFRLFLARSAARMGDVNCFRIAQLLLALQDGLPQIFVRQLPLGRSGVPERRSRDPVSVFIPHRGPLDYLITCLLSLLNEKHADVKVEVVFDEEILPRHLSIVRSFPQVSFYALRPHGGGPFVARQFLIERSRTDLVAHQDSDDLATSDRMAVLQAVLDGSDAEIVGCHELRVDEIKRQVIACRFPLDVNASLMQGPEYAQLFPTTLARRQSILLAGGLSTVRSFSSDLQFLLRAFFSGRKMANVDEFLYVRRRWKGSLTASRAVGYGTPQRQAVANRWKHDFLAVQAGSLALEDSSLGVEVSVSPFEFTDFRNNRTIGVNFMGKPRRPGGLLTRLFGITSKQQ